MFLIEPEFGEVHGSFRPCDSTENEASQRPEHYEGAFKYRVHITGPGRNLSNLPFSPVDDLL